MGTKIKVVASVIVICLATTYLSADTEKVYTGVPEQLKSQPTPIPEITPPAKPEMKLEMGKKIKVEKFLISGNKRVSTDELLAAIEKYKGKELALQQLVELADIVTRKYWEKGYITSFAYIPAQKFERGILEIEVVEGKAGNIVVENNKYYTTQFISKYFTSVLKEGILDSKTMERALLLLNEFPQLSINATLRKGEQPNTSDIVLNVKEKRYPMNFSLFYNNFGSKYTGEHRVGLVWDWGNLTKNGDILSLTGITTPEDFNQMFYWKAGYSIPLNATGTKLALDYSKMKYEIGKELAILDITGEAEVFGFSVSHPLVRARDKNLYWNAGLRHKLYENFLFEKTYTTSSDDYSVIELGIEGDKIRGKNHSYFSLKTTAGLGDIFGMDEDRYTSSSRPGLAGGEWVKLNLDLTNITKLGSCQLITRGSGQFATSSLVTAEEFSIGGPDSVRGYPVGEYLGDYGYLLSAELRTPFLPGKSNANNYANWAFFVDHGGVYYDETLPGEKKENYLTSAGLGLRISVPARFNLRFDAAYPLGQDASDGDDWRYWLNAAFEF